MMVVATMAAVAAPTPAAAAVAAMAAAMTVGPRLRGGEGSMGQR